MSEKVVLVPLAEGFEEVEALTVVDLLRRAGIEVLMVSIGCHRSVTGAHGIEVISNGMFGDVKISEVDGIVLPGGMPGTKNLLNCNPVKDAVVELYQNNKVVAAICAAPWILAECGVLEGREATCYIDHINKLRGASYVEKPVVVSDQVVTSRGVGTAIDFSLKLIEKMISKEVSENIKEAIHYKA